jgi:uncharacterized protein YjdB
MSGRVLRVDHVIRARRAAAWLVALAVWSCSGSTATDAGSSGDVAAIEITPSTSSLAVGAQLPLTAVARGVDGKIVTDAALVWSVKDPSIATVSSTGVVTGVALGNTQIAASANGKSGLAVITVLKTPVASVVVRPLHVDAIAGSHTQLTAITYDAANNILSDRAVVWASSNANVATVDANGMVNAVAPGSATITGTAEGKSDAATFTVTQGTVASVAVTPNPVSITVGQSSQLQAAAHDASGITITGRPVSWSSGNTAIATVSESGLVKGVAAGTTTITATIDGKTGSTPVTVTNIPVASVAVQPTSTSVAQGSSVQFFATVKDANGTVVTDRVVAWTSSNEAVATVSPGGVVTGKGAGNATITATSEGVSGSGTVNVLGIAAVPVASVAVSPAADTVTIGQTVTLTATTKDANGNVLTGRAVTWTTSNAGVATVSSTGDVTGVSADTVTITATSEGKSGSSKITVTPAAVGTVVVTPPAATVVVLQTTQLAVVVTDINGAPIANPSVTWRSSNPLIAMVSQTGLVTGIAPGKDTVSATSGGKADSSIITVSLAPVASVDVSPDSTAVTQGQSAQFTAVTKDLLGNTLTGRAVTWTSSNTAVATVDANGKATAVSTGTATTRVVTITATSEGKSGSAKLVVNPAPVASVTVSPQSATIKRGDTKQYSAVAFDASGKALSGRTFIWTSSDPTVATVDQNGLVKGISEGKNVVITATSEGISGSAVVTVNK